MSRLSLSLTALALVFGLLGCGKKDAGNGAGTDPGAGGDKPPAADFSTPSKAVETFIRAGAAKDAETLSQCFAVESSREFKELRDKSATVEQLDELAGLLAGGPVTGEALNGDQATVSVKLSSRDERIALTKGEGGWKIVDF